jgi:PadR family transcriptional regulator PadR
MDGLLSARTAILQALIRGASYGLELIDRVRDHSGGVINLRQGSVYPTLRELERDGLVRSWEDNPLPERGGRPRRYYELTAEGLRVAREENRTLLEFAGSLAAENA